MKRNYQAPVLTSTEYEPDNRIALKISDGETEEQLSNERSNINSTSKDNNSNTEWGNLW